MDIFVESNDFNNEDDLMIFYNQITKDCFSVDIAQLRILMCLQLQLEKKEKLLIANKMLFIVLTRNIKIPAFIVKALIDKAKEERILISCRCLYLRVSNLINEYCRDLIQCGNG